nr:MAG TPA: hypothetical protein [Bacteriophage sp.]
MRSGNKVQNQKSTVICRPSLIKSVAGNIKHRAAFCLSKDIMMLSVRWMTIFE